MGLPDPLSAVAVVVVMLGAAIVVSEVLGDAVTFVTGPLVLYLCLRSVGGERRQAVRARLGGRDEVRRFTTAWTTGEVPAGVDRNKWLAELDHLPDGTSHRALRHASAVVGVALTLVAIAVLTATVVTSGEEADQLRYVAFLTIPFAILFLLMTVALRISTPPDERTARLRRALEER